MKSIALGAVLALAGLAAAQDSAKIEWKPKVGSSGKYKIEMSAHVDAGGQPGDMQFSMMEAHKVTKIAEGKVTVESTQSNFTLMFGGNDMSQMFGDRKTNSTSVLDMNGVTLETKSDAPDQNEMNQDRLANAVTHYYPNKDVKVGETWSWMPKADVKKGTVDGEATYKLEAIEKVGEVKAFKISYNYKEKTGDTPMSVVGTFWLNADTTDLIKGEYKLKNVEFPSMPPTDAVVKVTHID